MNEFTLSAKASVFRMRMRNAGQLLGILLGALVSGYFIRLL